MENRKSITILHLWPSPPLFSSLYCSGTVWEPRYTCSWSYFPCGWHNLLPLHRVFLYGGICPHWLAHTPVSGQWHVVWHGSKLHKWVLYAQKHKGKLESCFLVLWNTLKRPLCCTMCMLWKEKNSNALSTHYQRRLRHSPKYTSAMNSTIQCFLVDHI